MSYHASCYRHRILFLQEGDFVVYADSRMGLPSYSEWMIPGTQLEDE